MAITLLTLKGNSKVEEVYLDVDDYGDKTWTLKQYDETTVGGDWIELTKPMLLQLRDWITKELG